MSGIQVRDARGGGWWWGPNAIIDDYGDRLGVYGIAVYVCLCRHAGQDQTTWVSQQRIADLVHASRQQVNLTIAKLRRLGLLAIEERVDPQTGRQTSLYTLLSPPPAGGENLAPLSTTTTPLSTTTTGGVNDDDTPLSTTTTAIKGLTRPSLTRIHEQDGGAAAAGGNSAAAAPPGSAAPAATAPAPDGEKPGTGPGPAPPGGDDAAGSRMSPPDGATDGLLTALGAPATPANRRGMARLLAAYPRVPHALEAAMCAAHYAHIGPAPPTLPQYADWCRRVRGSEEEHDHDRPRGSGPATTGAGAAGQYQRPGGDRADPGHDGAPGGAPGATPGESANARGWREFRERARAANRHLLGDLPDLPAAAPGGPPPLPDLPL